MNNRLGHKPQKLRLLKLDYNVRKLLAATYKQNRFLSLKTLRNNDADFYDPFTIKKILDRPH